MRYPMGNRYITVRGDIGEKATTKGYRMQDGRRNFCPVGRDLFGAVSAVVINNTRCPGIINTSRTRKKSSYNLLLLGRNAIDAIIKSNSTTTPSSGDPNP